MTVELYYLLLSVILAIVLTVVAVLAAMAQVGLPALVGNREDLPERRGLAGRAERAHRNLLESLVLFAILVLIAKAVGVSNALTVLGAQLYFWGRVAHAAVYIAGIAWARTAVWAVSVIGLLLILSQLL